MLTKRQDRDMLAEVPAARRQKRRARRIARVAMENWKYDGQGQPDKDAIIAATTARLKGEYGLLSIIWVSLLTSLIEAIVIWLIKRWRSGDDTLIVAIRAVDHTNQEVYTMALVPKTKAFALPDGYDIQKMLRDLLYGGVAAAAIWLANTYLPQVAIEYPWLAYFTPILVPILLAIHRWARDNTQAVALLFSATLTACYFVTQIA